MTHGPEIAVTIRPAQRSDLDAINGIVDAAVTSWPLPEPVRHQTLTHSHYEPIDLDEAVLLLAVSAQRHILGFAACCHIPGLDTPAGKNALLLDGPYVHPRHAHHGIGSQLLDEAIALARRQGCDGLLAKAPALTDGFFRSHGMSALPDGNVADDGIRHYWRGFG